jgi:hypothetical protein
MKPSAKSREWEFFRDELVRCPVFVRKDDGKQQTPKQTVEYDEHVW